MKYPFKKYLHLLMENTGYNYESLPVLIKIMKNNPYLFNKITLKIENYIVKFGISLSEQERSTLTQLSNEVQRISPNRLNIETLLDSNNFDIIVHKKYIK